VVIIEDLRRFEKTEAMFLLVLASFLSIPLEYQHRVSAST
jgi:hypothetical protein